MQFITKWCIIGLKGVGGSVEISCMEDSTGRHSVLKDLLNFKISFEDMFRFTKPTNFSGGKTRFRDDLGGIGWLLRAWGDTQGVTMAYQCECVGGGAHFAGFWYD